MCILLLYFFLIKHASAIVDLLTSQTLFGKFTSQVLSIGYKKKWSEMIV